MKYLPNHALLHRKGTSTKCIPDDGHRYNLQPYVLQLTLGPTLSNQLMDSHAISAHTGMDAEEHSNNFKII
jgi:hypothetical protein